MKKAAVFLCLLAFFLSPVPANAQPEFPDGALVKVSFFLLDRERVCHDRTDKDGNRVERCRQQGLDRLAEAIPDSQKGHLYLGWDERVIFSKESTMSSLVSKIISVHRDYLDRTVPQFSDKYLLIRYEFDPSVFSKPTLTIKRFPEDQDEQRMPYTYLYPKDDKPYLMTVHTYQSALFFYPPYRKHWTITIKDDDPRVSIDKTYELDSIDCPQ